MSTAESTSHTLSNLLIIGVPVSPENRARIETEGGFTSITHVRDRTTPITNEQLVDADVIYGFPVDFIKSTKQVPRLKFIQLSSAGSELILKSGLLQEEESKRIGVVSAAGTHTSAIPQHFIAVTLMLYHQLQDLMMSTYATKSWGNRDSLGGIQGHRELRGKTVGLLGYGHIGREAARLSKAFGAKIIAANASGTKKPQDGYIIPGTGDPDGSLSDAWYSTSDPKSLAEFLSLADVILLSMPSTPATKHILNATTFTYLKPSAVIVNVGRGDAIDTDALVAALDEQRLAGAALDVTDPEPLPDGHTLYGRPNVIITPHLSGLADNYFDICTDILIANAKQWREGKELLNLVDRDRGY